MSNAKQVVVGGVHISLKDEVARDSIGNLSNLNTTAKNNLVAAINEAAQSGGGEGSDPEAVKYTSQSLNDSQKTQARTNIGAGTYSKPSGGIPASDLASGAVPDVSGFYTKPASGIPASDLASGVIPDVSGKQDTLVSGTNIKTINQNSLLGSGDLTIEDGEDGVGFETIETPQTADGTTLITLTNGDTITLDLNHNHGQYTKVYVCEDFAEYAAIAVKDPMTFYVIPEVALYLGSILVVEQSEAPLPYTPVAYIETDGTAYIDTGVKGNAPMSASFKMTPAIPASGNTYFLGCRKDSGSTRFIMFTISSSKACGYTYGSGAWSGQIDISDSVDNQTQLDVIVSYRDGVQNLGVKQDGESSYTTQPGNIAGEIKTDINIYLFAYNNAGSAVVCESGNKCHGLKLFADYNYNTLIFDGVPAYYNGEYGLWDKVSKTFLGNAAGSGSITGPSIQ